MYTMTRLHSHTAPLVAVPENKGTSTSVIVDSSLIRMCMEGPAVSLQGSPTVSPVTEALCASDPFPPNLPVSIYFLALSQAPPPLLKNKAIKIPVLVANIKNPARASAPSSGLPLKEPIILNVTPTVIGDRTASRPGLIICCKPAALTIETHCL